MSEVLLVVLGWLLGLASSPIVDYLSTRRVRSEFQSAVLREIGVLANRLAHVMYNIEVQYGNLDRKLLERVYSLLVRYGRDTKSEEGLLFGVRELLETDEPSLAIAAAEKKFQARNQGMAMKKIRLSFLEGHLGDLRLFGRDAQAASLELLAQVALFNSQVEEANEWFRMTFDSTLSEFNRSRVEVNLEQMYRNLGVRTRVLLEAIGEVEKSLPPTPNGF